MLHNHSTSRHIYITADKLHLNKLLHASTNAFDVGQLSPQGGGFHLHMAYAPHGKTPHQQGGTAGGIS
jgi:hypothetical protein